MNQPARTVPLDLTVLPVQERPRVNVYAAVYGEGGTGKGQFALRMAHWLTAPHGGIIIAIEADGLRLRHHAKGPSGTGFVWRPIVFDKADPLKLTRTLNELADSACVSPVPVAVIIDGMTRFWNDPGGLKWRAERVHGKVNKAGKAALSAWVPTGEEETALYRALRRLHDHAHVILCLEQANEFANQELVGVRMDFRKGLAHEVDFIFRMERYLGQSTTEHQAKPESAVQEVHRAIVEKTPFVEVLAHPDGNAEFTYPMPTGSVFPDPGQDVAKLIVSRLDGVESGPDAEAARYIKSLAGRSRAELSEAWKWVPHAWWPQDVKEETRQAITNLANDLPPAARPAIESVAVPNPAPEVAAGLDADSDEESWRQRANDLLSKPDQFEALADWARECGRFDDIAEFWKLYEEEANAPI